MGNLPMRSHTTILPSLPIRKYLQHPNMAVGRNIRNNRLGASVRMQYLQLDRERRQREQRLRRDDKRTDGDHAQSILGVGILLQAIDLCNEGGSVVLLHRADKQGATSQPLDLDCCCRCA